MKKPLMLFIRITVCISLLTVIFRSLDISRVASLAKEINLFWVSLALLLVFCLRFLMALRWKYILDYQNIKTPLSEIIKIIFISSSLGQLSPGGVGGDIIRGYQLNKRHDQLLDITGTILTDRLAGIYSMFFLSLIGALLAETMGLSTGLVFTLLLFNSIILFVGCSGIVWREKLTSISLFKKKILRKFSKLLLTITDYESLRKIMPKLFLLSIVIQLIRCLIFYLLYLSYETHISPVYFIIFIPIVFIVIFLPISVGGLGVREGALIYFFNKLGVSPEISTGVGIISHALMIIAVIPGFFLWLCGENKPSFSVKN